MLIAGAVCPHPPLLIPAALGSAASDPPAELRRVAGVYMLITPKGDIYFLADATVNIEPSAEDLAEIAICAAETARRFNVTPRVALLSFSNFGSVKHPSAAKVQQAVALLHERAGGFTVTFLVLAGFGSLVFAGALLFPHRPEELGALPARPQPAE